MKKLAVLISILFIGCNVKSPTQFSKEALNDTFISKEEKSVVFQEIISKYKGKKILIDVWASWCKDCVGGLPKVKKLQKDFPNVTFLFLSLDKDVKSWKKGIDRYEVEGSHYFMKSGWKGDFGKFLKLNSIPRYLTVDENGSISYFNATKATNKNIIEALKK